MPVGDCSLWHWHIYMWHILPANVPSRSLQDHERVERCDLPVTANIPARVVFAAARCDSKRDYGVCRAGFAPYLHHVVISTAPVSGIVLRYEMEVPDAVCYIGI